MPEYIERNKAKEYIKNYGKGAITDGMKSLDPVDDIILLANGVDLIPTADVVEVRHGEWIYHDFVSSGDGIKSGYSCSECRGFVDEEIFDTDEFHKSFCGCCGARMDGKGD